MTQENIELVRRCLEARIRGEAETALDLLHPDVVTDMSVRPDGKVYYGRAGARKAMQTWLGTWDDYRFEPREYIDAGQHVVVLWLESGRAKTSGIEMEMEGATVWTVTNGQVVEVRPYTDRAVALEAAGLSE